MRRKIVVIDEEKCTGCGLCVTSCAEGAIAIVDGKARLVSETYCDGLGDCLAACPEDAITIVEKEAEPFDETASKEHLDALSKKNDIPSFVCPGSASRQLRRASTEPATPSAHTQSELINWPVQLALVPPSAPYLKQADILLVADCVPFAMADFHASCLHGKPVLVACPKLDDVQTHTDKLTEVLNQAAPRSLSVLHMEVPCCSGLMRIAQAALDACDRDIPLHEAIVTINGTVRGD